MKKLMLLAGITALVVPAVSNAQLGLRGGLETPIYTHFDQNGRSGSFWLGDSFQPAINLIGEYYPIGLIGLGLEFREGFAATGTGYTRSGTSLGPNVTLDLSPLPIFVRGAIPIHFEPGSVIMFFRAAGGLKIGLPIASLYLEVTSDFPMAGSGVSFFGQQQLGFGAGLWFKL